MDLISFAGMKRICMYFTGLVAVGSLSLVSCDKAKVLVETATEKIKELKGEQNEEVDEALVTTVTTVGQEEEGKKIIMSEKRLVILEFYSDT